MSHSYDVGTRAWQPDAAEGWVASEVTGKKIGRDKVVLTFALDNGTVCLRKPSIALVLTKSPPVEQNPRDDGESITRWHGCLPPTSHEPDDA